MLSKQELGSKTAKSGFKNEHDIVYKFNNFKNDADARNWLNILGYEPSKVNKIFAIQIPASLSKKFILQSGISETKINLTKTFKKADIQIQLNLMMDDILYRENISCKKVDAENKRGFNQIDKRSVDKYQSFWNFDDTTAYGLKLFTGAVLNDFKGKINNRLFMNELPEKYANSIICFFTKNKFLVISDIIKGRGFFAAEWMIISKISDDKTIAKYYLKNINDIINHYAQGDVKISPKQSLNIGKITMQRKGGTPDPTSLQFKFNPMSVIL